MIEPIFDAAGSTIRVGDTITFASRPKWWQRILRRLRLMKPEPPLREFTVTWASDDKSHPAHPAYR